MLILNRRFGESIQIGDDIRITILDRHHNGQTRVGIEAPKHISILREELYKRGEVGEGREKQPPESEAADELERAHVEIQRLQSVLTTSIEIVAEIKEIEKSSTGDRTRSEALQVALNLMRTTNAASTGGPRGKSVLLKGHKLSD